jgi:hypothetical protein
MLEFQRSKNKATLSPLHATKKYRKSIGVSALKLNLDARASLDDPGNEKISCACRSSNNGTLIA